MADRQKKISELKKIFLQAKGIQRSDDGKPMDLKFLGHLEDALIDVGKEYFPELADEIYPYLNDPFSEFRAEAVRTLGWNSRLGIEEFRKKEAYQIWEQDQDEAVKIAALTAWMREFKNKKDPKVLQILFNILNSELYSSEIRAFALDGIFDVADAWQNPGEGYTILSLGDLKNPTDFDKAVDWGRVHRVMQGCVPGWKKA